MRRGLFAMLPMLALCMALLSCSAPGQPAADQAAIRPAEVLDFRLLYAQNCSGCHGPDGRGALTVAIGRPVYLAIADDPTIRRVIEDGRAGTPMPPFSQWAGGFLTGAQIDVLVRGIRAWSFPPKSQPERPNGSQPPAYASSRTGDAVRGQDVFAEYCSSCHGANGRGARAIADPSYLSLVTNQHLRTVVIAGMPNLGMPDWRGHAAPLSDADVTDVVAWLAMHRTPLAASLSH